MGWLIEGEGEKGMDVCIYLYLRVIGGLVGGNAGRYTIYFAFPVD